MCHIRSAAVPILYAPRHEGLMQMVRGHASPGYGPPLPFPSQERADFVLSSVAPSERRPRGAVHSRQSSPRDNHLVQHRTVVSRIRAVPRIRGGPCPWWRGRAPSARGPRIHPPSHSLSRCISCFTDSIHLMTLRRESRRSRRTQCDIKWLK